MQMASTLRSTAMKRGPSARGRLHPQCGAPLPHRNWIISLPPASFEQTGQKIRGAAQVGESGLATCLDLALLFASAMEQAGLNPLLLFTTGHAFAGVWLKREEFSTTVVDDITALRKRIQLKDSYCSRQRALPSSATFLRTGH